MSVFLFVCSHLAHLALTVSSQEGHVVDLIHHNKVLLLPLKVLWGTKMEEKFKKKNLGKKVRIRINFE